MTIKTAFSDPIKLSKCFLNPVIALLLLGHPYAASASVHLQKTLNPDVALVNFAHTLLKTFSPHQLVLVKNTYTKEMPNLGELITQQVEQPILVLDTLLYLKSQIKLDFFDGQEWQTIPKFTYNIRHAKYGSHQRIFLSFAQADYEGHEVMLMMPVWYRRPDGGAAFSSDVDDKQDILVQLIDMKLNWWRHKYNGVRLVNFFCRIPTHTILLEYNHQPNEHNNDGPLTTTHARYIHLRCSHERPSCIETFPMEVFQLSVQSIKESVRKSQKNFETWPIFVGMQDIFSYSFTWRELYIWERLLWRVKTELRAGADILMPLYAMAHELNFTMESKLGTELRQEHTCICGQVFHGMFQYHTSEEVPNLAKHTNFLWRLGGDMLICGAPTDSYDPFEFKSLLAPFPSYIWLILLCAAGLMSACLMIRTGSKAFGSSVIATLTPLVNQISDPGGANNGGRFWYTFWVFSIVFLSNWYLGSLESKEILPVTHEIGGSFREFQRNNNNYTFYTPPNHYAAYRHAFGKGTFGHYADSFKIGILKDHQLLTSLLQPAWAFRMPPEFFKLKSTCFLTNDYVIQVYKSYLTQELERSYVVLEEKFLTLPLWTVFAVPFGEPLHELYARLLDVGIRGHWMKVHNEWDREATIQSAWKVKEVKRKVRRPGLTQVSDPLFLESLSLLGIGILAGWVSLVFFEVARDAFTITFYYE